MSHGRQICTWLPNLCQVVGSRSWYPSSSKLVQTKIQQFVEIYKLYNQVSRRVYDQFSVFYLTMIIQYRFMLQQALVTCFDRRILLKYLFTHVSVFDSIAYLLIEYQVPILKIYQLRHQLSFDHGCLNQTRIN